MTPRTEGEREWRKHRIPKHWERREHPFGIMSKRGWLGQITHSYADVKRGLAVLVRPVESEWGPVLHLAIRNRPNTEVPWAVKQDVKDELFGTDRTAIEVFPARSELVDGANMYHLWVLPMSFHLPFTIKD